MDKQIWRASEPPRLGKIVAADERPVGLARQALNGVLGLLVLLAFGLILMIAVLWKSP